MQISDTVDVLVDLVDSLNSTSCCSRLAFVQPQLDFFRSEEKPDLLHYLLVLWGFMYMFWIQSMPSIPYHSMQMPMHWNGPQHLKEPSPIHMHCIQTRCSITPDNFNIIGREDHGLARTIKESIYIRVINPTLNRNVGKYNLHHIWVRVLFNTPDLNINKGNGHTHRTSLSGHAQSIPTNRHSQRTIGHALNSEHVHRIS